MDAVAKGAARITAAVSSSAKIIELRELLAAKYPVRPLRTEGMLPVGVPQVDTLLRGGLGLGGMTEVVCPSGGGLFLAALVRSTLRRKSLMALIDGNNSFDPVGVPEAALARILWVRTRSASEAVKAADLLLRDGNLSLVVMDLRRNGRVDTGSVPSPSWYRLQRVVEPANTAFVILTRQPLVSAARPRLLLDTRYAVDAFEQCQQDLMTSLNVSMMRRSEECTHQYA